MKKVKYILILILGTNSSNKIEKIDINIELDNQSTLSNTTNINNYFNIILNNSSIETKNFKLEISINKGKKGKLKSSFKKRKIKSNKNDQKTVNIVNSQNTKDIKDNLNYEEKK